MLSVGAQQEKRRDKRKTGEIVWVRNIHEQGISFYTLNSTGMTEILQTFKAAINQFVMFEQIQQELAAELQSIREAGLYKNERERSKTA